MTKIPLTKEEKDLLTQAIANFNTSLVSVYQNKDETRVMLEGAGFELPDNDGIDDEIYEAMMTLDWLKTAPDELSRIPRILLMGLMKIIAEQVPEGEDGNQEYDVHATLMYKGYRILEVSKPENLN